MDRDGRRRAGGLAVSLDQTHVHHVAHARPPLGIEDVRPVDRDILVPHGPLDLARPAAHTRVVLGPLAAVERLHRYSERTLWCDQAPQHQRQRTYSRQHVRHRGGEVMQTVAIANSLGTVISFGLLAVGLWPFVMSPVLLFASSRPCSHAAAFVSRSSALHLPADASRPGDCGALRLHESRRARRLDGERRRSRARQAVRRANPRVIAKRARAAPWQYGCAPLVATRPRRT